jgi:hypothetical protein
MRGLADGGRPYASYLTRTLDAEDTEKGEQPAMKSSIPKVCAAALLAFATAAATAVAAEPPVLTGVWKADPATLAAIRLGGANDIHPEYSDPTYAAAEEIWSIEIKEQKGRAFHGVASSPKGFSVAFVGVISFDGEHFTAAADSGGYTGEILPDGRVDICYMDHEDDRSQVSCFVMAKQ